MPSLFLDVFSHAIAVVVLLMKVLIGQTHDYILQTKEWMNATRPKRSQELSEQ